MKSMKIISTTLIIHLKKIQKIFGIKQPTEVDTPLNKLINQCFLTKAQTIPVADVILMNDSKIAEKLLYRDISSIYVGRTTPG